MEELDILRTHSDALTMRALLRESFFWPSGCYTTSIARKMIPLLLHSETFVQVSTRATNLHSMLECTEGNLKVLNSFGHTRLRASQAQRGRITQYHHMDETNCILHPSETEKKK